MTPATFPQSNILFNPPAEFDESQIGTIPAFVGVLDGGNMDGSTIIVVAWKPTKEELDHLQDTGGPIYLTMIGGLAPHCLSATFEQATKIG